MKDDPKALLADLNTFYQKLLIPFMKIRRDMPFPTEPERRETDGEHAFTLSMIVLSLNERMGLNLDVGKLLQYALVHDLVEVHAGDLSVKAVEAEHAKKEEREFEALKVIKQDFVKIFPWVHTTIEAYEKREDEESKFVYIIDKYMGALGWIAGEGKTWAQYYPEDSGKLYHTVQKRLRAKVKAYDSGNMLEIFDVLHNQLEENREDYFKKSI